MAETRSRSIALSLEGVLLLSSVLMLGWQQMPPVVRPLYVVAYLVLAPGYAMVPSLGQGQRLLRLLLAVAVGVSLAIAVSTVMSETGFWHVAAAVRLTVGVVVVSALVRMWRHRVRSVEPPGRTV